MKLKQKYSLVRLLILFLILGIVSYIIFSISSHKSLKQINENFEETSSKLAFAKGISFIEYHGDKKVLAVSIESFSIERARLGPFAIGPMHIAYLNKVAIDMYMDENGLKIDDKMEKNFFEKKSMEDNKPDIEKPISEIRKNLPSQFRKVKGIEFKEVSLNLWKNEKRIFRIWSDSATIDRQTGDIVFTGHANMDAGENGRLQSHRIRWDRKTHLFKVMDPFYLIKNGKKTEGKGIETDYLMKKISYIGSTK